MDALIGYFGKQAQYFSIGRLHVELQPSGLQSRGQRYEEAALALEVTVEALHVALGASPIRSTQPQAKAVIFRKTQHPRMPTVFTLAVRIALDDHRLCVIEEHFLGNATEVLECSAQGLTPDGKVFLFGEAYERCAA